MKKKITLVVLLLLCSSSLLFPFAPSVFQVYQGGTGLNAVAAHQVYVGTATNTFTAKTIPDCPDTGGNHLNFTQSGDTFNCGTSGSGGITGSGTNGQLTKWTGSGSIGNADLSGDVTTSGGTATTVVKVDGVSYPASPSTHTVPVITASNTATYKSVPDCIDTGGNHLNYTQSTDAFSCGTSGATSYTFADNETPSGAINGSNPTFTLAHTPNPALSLNCYENGVQQRAAGEDFTLATAIITYVNPPSTGDTLICSYRY